MRSSKNKIQACFSLFILLASFFSCTAPIDIETENSKPVIVIDGILTDELKIQEVRLSRSSPYFDSKPNAPISGADIKITSSANEVFELLENDSIPGLYQSEAPWAAQAGNTYFLKVEADFDSGGQKELYEASENTISAVNIDSIKIVPMNIMGNDHYALNIYSQEPPGHDYYLLKITVNDSLISSKISKYITFDDVAFDGEYINGLTVTYLDDIKDRGDHSEEQRKNSIYVTPGDVVSLQMSRISKGYHDFINECQKEMRGENPLFGGPASNITTNISNHGAGYFSSYCIASNSAVVPEAETK